MLPCETILLGQFEQELSAIRMGGFSIAGYLALLAVGEVCAAQSGMVDVDIYDPSPLNWLFITRNTMEKPIRVDEDGRVVNALATDARWLDDRTFEMGGYSSINTRIAIMKTDPFTSAGLIESEDRSARLVLEANQSHWNHERGPRLQRAVFRNDLTPAQALELCISTEGEMDIATEVSPADAARVLHSQYAKLVECDANRVLVGILNRSHADVPLSDKRVRQALNLAVDCQKVIEQGLGGYANPICALTPSWCGGFPAAISS